MNIYHVVVSGKVTKEFQLEADCKEDAMVDALEFFNEFATNDFTDCDAIDEISVNAKLVSNKNSKDESNN